MVRTLPFHGRNMSSILIGGILFFKHMDTIIFQSFIPELFLSLSILFQLIFNVKLINNSKYNFPIIDKEVFYQTFFILICLFFLYTNLKIEGFLSNFLFFNDEGARILKILTLLTCFFTLIIVFQSFSLQRLNFFEFFTIFLLSLLSLLLLISSSDLISFYLVIEMQSLCFYILASFKRNSSFSTEAGLKYFISSAFISGVFLFGSSLIYGMLGTLSFNGISLILAFPWDSFFEPQLYVLITGVLCVTATLLFKIACAPFHFWAPDVYEGSPLSSTILFSIVPKLSLTFFFIKWILCLNTLSIQEFLLFCGVFSALVGTFFALSQHRMKKLIIYSSISQIGFIVAGLSVNTFNGYVSVFFFLIVYVITSILIWSHFSLFYSFQTKIRNFYKKNATSLYISSLTNFFEVNKLWSFSFIVIFFSIAGIPPLTGFLSKIFILLELVSSNKVLSACALIIISSVSVFYYIRIIKIIFFEPKAIEKNYEKCQIIFHSFFLDTIYFNLVILLSLLILVFFSPTMLILICQYIVLSMFGF